MDTRTIVVKEAKEYTKWFEKLRKDEKARINARIAAVIEHGHFGDCKYLGDHLAEMRWKNGFRVYFTRFEKTIVLLLLGGMKNGQKKDIQKARLLLRRYASFETKKRH